MLIKTLQSSSLDSQLVDKSLVEMIISSLKIGVSIIHYREPAPGLENYWIPQGNDTFMLSVSFRPSDGKSSKEILTH